MEHRRIALGNAALSEPSLRKRNQDCDNLSGEDWRIAILFNSIGHDVRPY
jgi:hypothetical protein